jgi:putative redox protein
MDQHGGQADSTASLGRKKMEAIARWGEGLQFTSKLMASQSIVMDASTEEGGDDKGPRPVELILVALAGCTGMDVLAILKKKRQEITDFQVKVDGERRGDHPKVFEKVHVTYEVTGKNIPLEAVQQAVHLSEKKYCSVAAMIRTTARITSDITIHEA